MLLSEEWNYYIKISWIKCCCCDCECFIWKLETTIRPKKSTRQLAYTPQHVSNKNQNVTRTLVKEETSFNQKQK
jgi:hypothetical protein